MKEQKNKKGKKINYAKFRFSEERNIIYTSKKRNTKKNIFKKYKHIEELSIAIAYDFIDKILIGSIGNYDEEANSRDIKIIWNFTI